MGFDWFRVDAALVDHPKVLALAAALDEPMAGWYFIRLLSWAQRYAQDGRFSGAVTVHLESFLGWRGAVGKLFATLREVGLIDATDDGFEVHDWWEKQGALVEKSKKDAARKRKLRRTSGAETARAGPRDGAGTGRDGTDVTRRVEAKKAREDDSPAGALRDAMDAMFAARRDGAVYAWSSNDEMAMGALLGQSHGDNAEILRRWRNCLDHAFPTWSTVTDFSRKWNDCAATQKQATGPPRDNRKSPVRAEDVDKSAFATTGDVTDGF